MDIEIKTWLYDIKQAIEEIESFFDDRPKIYADAEIRNRKSACRIVILSIKSASSVC